MNTVVNYATLVLGENAAKKNQRKKPKTTSVTKASGFFCVEKKKRNKHLFPLLMVLRVGKPFTLLKITR